MAIPVGSVVYERSPPLVQAFHISSISRLPGCCAQHGVPVANLDCTFMTSSVLLRTPQAMCEGPGGPPLNASDQSQETAPPTNRVEDQGGERQAADISAIRSNHCPDHKELTGNTASCQRRNGKLMQREAESKPPNRSMLRQCTHHQAPGLMQATGGLPETQRLAGWVRLMCADPESDTGVPSSVSCLPPRMRNC